MTASMDRSELLAPDQYDPYQPPEPRGNLLRLGVDLDGTLARPVWTPENPTSAIGDPIPEAVQKVKEAVAAGWKVWIHTARADTDYENIERWLNHHNIPFNEIRTGKPLFRAYVDDRAVPADSPDWTKPYSHRDIIETVLSVIDSMHDKTVSSHIRDELIRRGLL